MVSPPEIIPVCTGNTAACPYLSMSTRKHPRIYGEYARSDNTSLSAIETSPYARGIRQTCRCVVCIDQEPSPHMGNMQHCRFLMRSERIIPTYVGNTVGWISNDRARRNHPHIHGEYATKKADNGRASETPPTCAGNTLSDIF